MTKTARTIILSISLVFTASLTACISLASDITPPPNYATPVPRPTSSPVYPIVPPNPSEGAAIYADSCAPCHGETGKGDGTMASQLSVPPAALASPSVMRAARPMDWFELVTNGRMDRMMPPFGGSLSDRQRWDVISYVLSLGTTQTELARGKEIYTAQCIQCHGESGVGKSGAADWSDPTVLAQRSAQELFDTLSSGTGNMPAYAGSLSEADRWAVTAYVRSLSFAQAGTTPTAAAQTTPEAAAQDGQPTATVEATQTPVALQKFEIQGKVVLPSGATLESGITANLQLFDGMTLSSELTTDVSADGSFSFKDIEPVDGRVYMVLVNYEGLQYSSNPIHTTDIVNGQPVKVEVPVSLTTTDASVLSAQRMHVFFDLSNSTTSIQVVELYVINNSSDRVVVAETPGQPVVTFDLPAGATNLQFQDGTLGDGQYMPTESGFGDLRPISPGDGIQELFAYELPYTTRLSLDLPISLPVESAVIMVPQGIKLKSSQLSSSGQSSMSGMNIEIYTSSNLAKDSTLKMTLSGRPGASSSTSNNLVAIILGGVALAAALGGAIFLILRQRKPLAVEGVEEEKSPSLETSDSLMDAIIALDDEFQAGKLPREAYETRRAELKARLAELQGKG